MTALQTRMGIYDRGRETREGERERERERKREREFIVLKTSKCV